MKEKTKPLFILQYWKHWHFLTNVTIVVTKKAFQQDANHTLANHTCFMMNKFEYVRWGCPSTVKSHVRCLKVGMEGAGAKSGGGDLFLYGDVQCIVGNGHMGTRPLHRMTDGQTRLD